MSAPPRRVGLRPWSTTSGRSDAKDFAGRRSSVDEPPLDGLARELVAVGELQLAQDRGDVRLDRLGGDAQAQRDLLVEVAAREQLQDLALARREGVELGVRRARRGRGGGGC